MGRSGAAGAAGRIASPPRRTSEAAAAARVLRPVPSFGIGTESWSEPRIRFQTPRGSERGAADVECGGRGEAGRRRSGTRGYFAEGAIPGRTQAHTCSRISSEGCCRRSRRTRRRLPPNSTRAPADTGRRAGGGPSSAFTRYKVHEEQGCWGGSEAELQMLTNQMHCG